MSARKTFIPFSEEQVGGTVIVSTFAFLSTGCILSVALRLYYLSVKSSFSKDASPSKEAAFFRTQLGYLAACLLIANGFNSLAGLLEVPFLAQHGITRNTVCVAQAFINQLGNISNAYFTSALALHTFGSLVLRRRRPFYVYWMVISIGWIVAALLASLPLILKGSSGPMYGPSGISCHMLDAYAKEQFFLHLLPIFLAAFVSAICFAMIFLVIRGTLVVKGGIQLRLDPEARSRARKGEYQQFITRLAKAMLWFPAAYIVLLIPYSVITLMTLGEFTVPFQATIFALGCWFTLGIVNVLLLYNTFRIICPAFAGHMHLDSESTESDSSVERGEKSYDPSRMVVTPTAPFISNMPPGLLAYPERAVSVSSYYDYPSFQNPVGKKIRSKSRLGRESFVSGDPAQLANTASPIVPVVPVVRTVAMESQDVPMSLPIPPRKLSPPIILTSEVQEKLAITIPSPISPRSENTMGDPFDQVRTSSGSDLDGLSPWLAMQNPDGSMPRGVKNLPMLSAVGGTTFSPNELPSPLRSQSRSQYEI